MTDQFHPISSYRAKCPKHTGVTGRVKEALRRGPSSINMLAGRLNAPPGTVRAAIYACMSGNGGISPAYKVGREMFYELAKDAKPVEHGPNVAGRITVGRGSKWGAGLV